MNNIQDLNKLFKLKVQVTGIRNGADVYARYTNGAELSISEAIYTLEKLNDASEQLIESIDLLENAIEAATKEPVKTITTSTDGPEIIVKNDGTIHEQNVLKLENTEGYYNRREHPDTKSSGRTGDRKRRDCTKLTKRMYTYILSRHQSLLIVNANRNSKTPRIGIVEFVNGLNRTLGMDKSTTFYSKIWNKKIDVDMLPLGKVIEEG